MKRRPLMRDAEPAERFQKPRPSELRSAVYRQRQALLARLPQDSRPNTADSTAASASSVQQRRERCQPTTSRVQQSIIRQRVLREIQSSELAAVLLVRPRHISTCCLFWRRLFSKRCLSLLGFILPEW